MNMPHALVPESREPSRAGPSESTACNARRCRSAVAALLAAWLALASRPAEAACAGSALPAAPAALQRTELFLGLSLAGGHSVTPRAWAKFEREVLGPQLCGYTVIDARGGWLAGDGRLIREKAKIVVTIHRPEALPAITAVAQAWRTRFRQEAVLRATQPVEGGLIGP